MYVKLLYHCYVDSGLDNKETFAKDHMWTLFNSALKDIEKVSVHAICSACCTGALTNIHVYIYALLVYTCVCGLLTLRQEKCIY